MSLSIKAVMKTFLSITELKLILTGEFLNVFGEIRCRDLSKGISFQLVILSLQLPPSNLFIRGAMFPLSNRIEYHPLTAQTIIFQMTDGCLNRKDEFF